MKKIFKYLNKILSAANPVDVAVNELLQARLALLQAETGVEYSMALVDFNKKRVKRLEAYLDKIVVESSNDTK